eukprot:400741-Ditylum_brightwellii.AAC.1
MIKEIEALTTRKTRMPMIRSELPRNTRVIPTTWDMKIKRYPDGAFRSFKTRYCLRGILRRS